MSLVVPRKRILTVLALVILAACTINRESRKKKFIALGNKYFQRQMYKEASILYRKAIQEDGRFGEAYYRLALTQLKLGKPNDANSSLLRAVELQPENLDAFDKLANLYLLALSQTVVAQPKQTFDSLIRFTERAEKNHPGAYQVLYVKGRIALLQKNYRQAIPLLRRADKANPSDRRARKALVAALAHARQFDEAEKVATSLIKDDPTSFSTYDILYMLYLRDKQPRKAEALLQVKCKAAPRNTLFLIQLAEHCNRVGEKKKALRILGRLTRHPGDFDKVYETVAAYYLRTGSPEPAAGELREGLRPAPEKAKQIRFVLADILAAQGKGKDALQLTGEALKQDPGNSLAIALRGYARLRSGDPNEFEAAVDDLRTAVSRLPRNPGVRYRCGQAYLATGDISNATLQFREALKLRPEFPEVKYALMRLHLSRHEFTQVTVMANDMLALKPYDAIARRLRDQALIGLREYESARKDLETLYKQDPRNRDTIFLLANLDLIEKNYNRARERFQVLAETDPPDPRGVKGLVDVYAAQGQLDRLRRLLEREAKKAPGRTDFRMALGSLAMTRKDYAAAARQFRMVLNRNPDYAPALNNLACTLAETGADLDQALAYAQRALARSPGSAAYADTLGLVYIKRNLNENAIAVLRKVVDKNPSRAAFRYHLALALFQNGDLKGARRELLIARNSKLSAAEATKIHDLLAKLDG